MTVAPGSQPERNRTTVHAHAVLAYLARAELMLARNPKLRAQAMGLAR